MVQNAGAKTRFAPRTLAGPCRRQGGKTVQTRNAGKTGKKTRVVGCSRCLPVVAVLYELVSAPASTVMTQAGLGCLFGHVLLLGVDF